MVKIKDFIKKHSILLVGIILYVIVYIISCNYDPWAYDIGTVRIENSTSEIIDLYIPDILPENRIIKKIPLDILYFGIADAAVLMYNGLVFSLFLVTYVMVFTEFAVKKVCDRSGIGKIERFAADHIYGNIVLYGLSVVLSKLNELDIDQKDIFEAITPKNNDMNMVFKILIALAAILALILLIAFFFIPLFPTIIYFFTYMVAFNILGAIIYYIDTGCFSKIFSDNPLIREILSFVLALLIILVFNIIMERLYSKLQKISIFLALKFIHFIKWIASKVARR